MDFHRFKDMDLVEPVHIFGFSNIHTFGPSISLIVYQMGRLCGGAHEISGIKAIIFLRGWVGGGGTGGGGVGGGGVRVVGVDEVVVRVVVGWGW